MDPDEPSSPVEAPFVVIGAGPAGLTAAYELVKRGARVVVVESDDVVGGISRTVERDGWRFDLGGHRFFTKVQAVEDLWHEILPDEDFLMRPRMSRIFYDGKYYDYPLKASNALKNLGVIEAVRCVGLLRGRQGPSAEGPVQLRELAGRAVRVAPVPALLQDLHREGLGRAGERDARRLGRPARQGPVARQGHHERAAAPAQPEGDHEPHRGVPVPEVRAGDDVGALPRPRRRARRRGPHARAASSACTPTAASSTP